MSADEEIDFEAPAPEGGTIGELAELMQQAVDTAKARGYEVTGWSLQADVDGVAVWLYLDTDTGQTYLGGGIDVEPTILAAARACLARAGMLPPKALAAAGES